MAKTHYDDLEVENGPFSRHDEEITSDTDISITSGVVELGANLCATALTVGLPLPVATDDDYKRLAIVDTVGAAHKVTPATPFGNGGANEAVATFSGVIGDTLELEAYQGYWYVIGKHQITIDAT